LPIFFFPSLLSHASFPPNSPSPDFLCQLEFSPFPPVVRGAQGASSLFFSTKLILPLGSCFSLAFPCSSSENVFYAPLRLFASSLRLDEPPCHPRSPPPPPPPPPVDVPDSLFFPILSFCLAADCFSYLCPSKSHQQPDSLVPRPMNQSPHFGPFGASTFFFCVLPVLFEFDKTVDLVLPSKFFLFSVSFETLISSVALS